MKRGDYWLAAGICAGIWMAFVGWSYYFLLQAAGS